MSQIPGLLPLMATAGGEEIKVQCKAGQQNQQIAQINRNEPRSIGMDQLETTRGSEQAQAASKYAAGGYRLPVSSVARHAAEMVLQGCIAVDGDGTEVPPPANSETCPPSPGDETTAEQSTRDKPPVANVYTDPERHAVSLLLDDTTANLVVYAVRVLIADSEAHAREVRLFGATLPADSYGAANRQAIADRHERIASRLRVLERNYRNVVRGG
jgi:hypothetical protein